MEVSDNLLIVVDPGHGGYDNGARSGMRNEKDDNLRLGLAVQRELLGQGVKVLMTRDDDTFVSLKDRADMANQSGADLFIALHRNSYPELTPSANGVENYIYLTAPEETSGRAAKLVQDAVVKVGVVSDRGVKRGNYYVLRKTTMPSMLLEMGYIINPEDNRLFDQNLDQYAKAIAQGILAYFGIPYMAQHPAAGASELIKKAQQVLASRYGLGISPTGTLDDATKKAAVVALQAELNHAFGSGLAIDSIAGTKTLRAIPTMTLGSQGNVVFIFQVYLLLHGYDPGPLDGVYGPATQRAVQQYQLDHRITPDGILGPSTAAMLVVA